MIACLLKQLLQGATVVLFLLAPSAFAVKDDSYYSANSGNPNMDLPMYWKDSENVLQDLSQFSSLYVEFHSCVWSWMKYPGAVDDGNSGSGDYANDYWYTESVPPMGANVAFSLYGALAGQKFEGCNRNSFINSFYTDFGFNDFARAMSYTGLSGFKGYTGNINSDDDYYSSGTTALCQGGYGVGCDSRYGFAMHKYSTDECNPQYYTGVSDQLSTLNSAMHKAQCVKIYDSKNFAGFDYIYGTPLELLTYSTACNYMNQERPDGSCPDPYGKIAYYIKTFNQGIMKKREDPWETYHTTVDRDLKMVVTGAALLAASVVIMFFECCFRKNNCCYSPVENGGKESNEKDDENEGGDGDVTVTSEKDNSVSPEECIPSSPTMPTTDVATKDSTQNRAWLSNFRVTAKPSATISTTAQTNYDPPSVVTETDEHRIPDTSNKVPEVWGLNAGRVDVGAESNQPAVPTPYQSVTDKDTPLVDSKQIRQMLLDKLARHQAETLANLEAPSATATPKIGKDAKATTVPAAGRGKTNKVVSAPKNNKPRSQTPCKNDKPRYQSPSKKPASLEVPLSTTPGTGQEKSNEASGPGNASKNDVTTGQYDKGTASRATSPTKAAIPPLEMRNTVLEAIERRRQATSPQRTQVRVPVTATTPSMGHDTNNEPKYGRDANKRTAADILASKPVTTTTCYKSLAADIINRSRSNTASPTNFNHNSIRSNTASPTNFNYNSIRSNTASPTNYECNRSNTASPINYNSRSNTTSPTSFESKIGAGRIASSVPANYTPPLLPASTRQRGAIGAPPLTYQSRTTSPTPSLDGPPAI